MKARFRKRITLVLCGGILLGSTLVFGQLPATSPDKKSSEVFKNVQVLKDVPSDQLVPSMQFITSALGVQCEYCHVEKAFDKDDKKPKQTARKMIHMMFAINTSNFEGHQVVTCYSCHRGSPKPLAIPMIAESQTRLLNEPAREPQPTSPNLPKADEVVQKYIAALGGTTAISKLTSLQEQGTFEAGSRQFPVEVSKKDPARIATITHFPGADNITAFDGTSGWILFPGRPLRAMTAADADANRLDADLHLPLDLGKVFAELQVESTVKVGNQDAVVLSGRRPGQPPVEMYFDAQTGLLIRTVRYSPSALGLNPTQTDYSDYREVGGVKTPFHWVSATPTGRFSVQIATAQPNASIRDDVFSKPPAPSVPNEGK